MSYCRWSSDNFQCDVYCYESNWGFEVHIAGSRHVGDIPELDCTTAETLRKTYQIHRDALEKCTQEPIGLEWDGESFTLGTPGECADKLEEIRKLGYNVPQYAIEELREEEKELEDGK